ncbi:MFS transporter [Streptomyces sp. RFCAC02]|uniref:MFS transporter n=1 Tax=Streptomyces sp. RFCAC02 TaxID=2499143 RepID=UPI0010210EA1|nr:MFS transporter [Streptomyces sp. RFCAC02]
MSDGGAARGTEAAAGGVPGAPVPLWRERNWQRLWFSQAVSVIGDQVFNTTVLLWIGASVAAGEPWAPAAVSGVLLAAALPVLLVGPVAGVYVDRWDHARVMRVADLLRAAFIGVLLVIPLAGGSWPAWLQVALIYLMVALSSSAAQFFNPARFSLIASMVHADHRTRAFGLLTATSGTAAIIGPPLAAPLLFGVGEQWALVVNVCSFLVSYAAIRLIRVPAGGRAREDGKGSRAFRAELLEGFRFFVGNRMLLVVVGTVFVYMVGVGALNVLNVFFVTDNLHTDAGWLGTLNAAFGVGSIAGSLVAAKFARKLGETRTFAYGILVTGVIVLLYSRQSSLWFALALLSLASISIASVNVVVGPLVLRATPQHLLGRINSVLNPTVYLASILSMAVTGFLASTALRDLDGEVWGVHVGRIDTIYGCGALMMIIAGVCAIRPLARYAARAAEAGERDDGAGGTGEKVMTSDGAA